MITVRYERGAHLPAEGLWLDPRGARDLAFVSHAHSDHTGRHGEAILTEATSRLMAARLGRARGREHVLPCHTPLPFRDFEIELLPAGHVLGSAQCLVRSAAGTLLYTGDFKLRASPGVDSIRHASADTLIMETTFGLPRYVFPPDEEVAAGIVKFCVESREAGATPVLLAWSLGKAQETLHALHGAGLPIALHESVHAMTRIHESCGVSFPAYGLLAEPIPRGSVIICPPNAAKTLARIPRPRTAILSGWAMDSSTRYRMGVDAAFPLSDHAGYDDLLRYVAMVNPKRVLTTHGFAREFARDLRARGIEAWSLDGEDQLELALG